MPAVTVARSAEKEALLFESKVVPEPNTGCWLWTGGLDRDGYGHMHIRLGEAWTTTPAHRGMWQLRHGPMPADLMACHSCDTPCCVNPDHVWPGTAEQNNADCQRKGRKRSRPRNPCKLHIKRITVADAEAAGRDPSFPEERARRLLMRAYKRRDPVWREAHIARVMASRTATRHDPIDAQTEAEKRAMIAGYGMAVAILMRLRDEPVIAADLIIESGFGLADFRASGLEAYDLNPLEKLYRSERRLRRRSPASSNRGGPV
jgi:hypothetical protein